MRKSQQDIKKKLLKYGLMQVLPPNNKEFQEQELLWRAVIDRALIDVITPDKTSEYVEALTWFDLEDEDFIEVCYSSSVDPSYVIRVKDQLLDTYDEDIDL